MVFFQPPRGVSHQDQVSVFAVIGKTIIDLTTLASAHIIKRPLTEEEVSVLLRATVCFEHTPVLELCLPPTVSCLSICSYVFFWRAQVLPTALFFSPSLAVSSRTTNNVLLSFLQPTSQKIIKVGLCEAGEKQNWRKRISDQNKKRIYLNKIAPHDMRPHLMLNQQRLDTSDAIAEEIEEQCDALEELNREAKELLGVVKLRD